MNKKILLLVFIFLSGVFVAQTVSINTDLTYSVNLPAKKTGKIPVLIVLHGYGSNEADLLSIAKGFDERFITFSLRAPYPANGGSGYSWFHLDRLPEKQYSISYSEATSSRTKIFSFISNACRAYKADSNQVFVMGFSQGAVMCYDVALAGPSKIKGMIALSGFMLKESKALKTPADKLAKINFFIGHGTQDNVVDYKGSEEAAIFLKEKKVPVTFKSYEFSHTINGAELNDIKSWLKNNIAKDQKEEKKN